jgi:hypothetical protein
MTSNLNETARMIATPEKVSAVQVELKILDAPDFVTFKKVFDASSLSDVKPGDKSLSRFKATANQWVHEKVNERSWSCAACGGPSEPNQRGRRENRWSRRFCGTAL